MNGINRQLGQALERRAVEHPPLVVDPRGVTSAPGCARRPGRSARGRARAVTPLRARLHRARRRRRRGQAVVGPGLEMISTSMRDRGHPLAETQVVHATGTGRRGSPAASSRRTRSSWPGRRGNRPPGPASQDAGGRSSGRSGTAWPPPRPAGRLSGARGQQAVVPDGQSAADAASAGRPGLPGRRWSECKGGTFGLLHQGLELGQRGNATGEFGQVRAT